MHLNSASVWWGSPRSRLNGFSTPTSKDASIRHLDTPVQNPRAGSDQYGGELITQLFGDDPGRDRVRWRDLSAAGCGHSESDHAASEPIRLAVGPPEGP